MTKAGACLIAALAVAAGVWSGGAAAGEVESLMGTCAGETFCIASAAQFRREYPQAWRGNYQAQRNVAYCLITGCDGAVRQNELMGCAWRLVILASGAPQTDRSDGVHMRICRDRLSPEEAVAVLARANAIFRRVYGRPMP